MDLSALIPELSGLKEKENMRMPKKKEAAPKIEIKYPDHYTVLGADLSLTRPGLALLEVDKRNGVAEIKLLRVTSVNNKGKSGKKSHGQILYEIEKEFLSFLSGEIPDYFVREKEIMHMKNPSERSVTKVVGLMDILIFELGHVWHEIYPVSVKSLVAGSGKAEKKEVAAALPFYVGDHNYRNDDESDATAVAVAWLIDNGQIKQKEA